MNAIVSVTRDWGIGLSGRLLVRNPADMRFFVERTMGATVLCGQATYESFPGGALKGRRNVVLSLDDSFCPPDAEVVRSIDDALAAVAGVAQDEVWLIGGQSVYRQLLGRCRLAYVTWHDVKLAADAWFPDLDADASWRLVRSRPGGITERGVPFEFRVYEHIGSDGLSGTASDVV